MQNKHCSFDYQKEFRVIQACLDSEKYNQACLDHCKINDDNLMEESIEVWKIYKLLQRMKKIW